MAVLLTQQVYGNEVPQDELVRFLEQHPAYYSVMKSGLCVKILQSLARGARNIMQLKRDFPKMEAEDLEALIGMLVEVGVVSHLDVGSNRVYYTNKEGKAFLVVYSKTREKFLGKEQEEPF